jgi:hypothetical protein
MCERDTSGSAIKKAVNAEHERRNIIREFGDLALEENRISYVQAMLFSRVFPGFDAYSKRLERAFMHLPSGTMHEVVTTTAKLHEAFRQNRAILLEET